MRERKQIDVTKYQGNFDVQYSPVSSTCKMDIFLPEGNGPFPVIVSIHGGAFKKCDKRDEEMILDMLHGLDKGYAVIGVNYRLSGEAQFPEPVKDIKQAIRFIKDHADEYHLNKDKIVVWGGSAGGYFSLMAGLIDCYDMFDDEYSSTTDTKIQGLIAWFPPVNFANMDDQLKESGLLKDYPDHDDEQSPESLFIGGPITQNSDCVQKANPETYLHINVCPMFIQHGRIDRIVPYQQSEDFVKKAKECGIQNIQYEIIENADHGDLLFSTPENIAKVYQFIEKCLR
ncbi:alpha/beta hydrolase [Candidatus Stoquefichus massiliensis]|uniref:alpha/beta hydrolase n=1 Tax=Candidatus Stoquefichus massiliensis TaxID=1470350 RepID=UPI0004898B1F|nr:alpha/beta hydrolase [Candidatus Stoquefichus massiliensis]